MPTLENNILEGTDSDPDTDNRLWHWWYGFFARNGYPVGMDDGLDCGWTDGCEDGLEGTSEG